ncbi:thioredoxin domain-containing protein [Rhodospirillaceae bacterium KN72]|uniref:Thioredoxin domain-containing protein n=1 Tax=Pacificispira spongiicola TaxID=2729598 RepID=A0A7Y0HEM1_9PROT|nr:thioredoxin domain-containing protein [Pacificispira spongiicola]NMM45006.1 thioredoxin domain-containing protein [Pacificispira spongiicola]
MPSESRPKSPPENAGATLPAENLLTRETSPYLLQHKDNPVHWRAWGPEALAEARATGKPILLSVGYAACHWCHVMAHESFENPDIAALMNELFVNIKVDREERPDIDTIYQSALHMLGQQGGWPLTMFLTPDGEPFWGGTYFPSEAKWGRPGFPEILTGLSKAFEEAPDKIGSNVDALRKGLATLAAPRSGDDVSRETADQISQRLLSAFDRDHGGIGEAPKFPQAPILLQMWNAGQRQSNQDMIDAVLFTLRQICEGGIYDHLGGGFARYAVDREWLVPHFEKMLYDNAQLLDLLSLAWRATGDRLFRQRAEETVGWLLSDMQMPEGGFASARDADSEGEEGRFYVWDEAEIDALLGERSTAFKVAYDVQPGGNWEGKTILNRLHLRTTPDEETEAAFAADREILAAAREKRVPPLKDDKQLADWNGLTVAALAQAGQVFDRPDWIAAARKAFDFVAGPMADGSRLRHSYRNGVSKHTAVLDDYAAMMRAALVLHEVAGEEVTGQTSYLDQAESWVEILDRHYYDAEGGAYFLTADDADALIARTKSASDNATPSGNGVLVWVFAKLHWLTGKDAYGDRAQEIVRSFAGELERNFYPYSNIVEGAQFLRDGHQIVVVGAPDDETTAALLRAAQMAPLTDRVLIHVAPGTDLPEGHPAALKAKTETAAAFVCRGPVCSLPVRDAGDLSGMLTPLPRKG